MNGLPLFDWVPPDETPQQSRVRRAFEAFHAENPHVYRMFGRFTQEAAAAGHRNFSAYAVAHRIRWETSIVTTDDEFKLNNNYIAYYSRLWMAEHPAHAGFFRLRRLRSDEEDVE